jgi:hypothetical protein
MISRVDELEHDAVHIVVRPGESDRQPTDRRRITSLAAMTVRLAPTNEAAQVYTPRDGPERRVASWRPSQVK